MERSEIMRRVKQSNTTPEMLVRRTLHAMGYRYVLHDKRLPGSPDIVFPSRRIAVFVHGCFWHRHPDCSRATVPRGRRQYWEEKFARNVDRDIKNLRCLEQLGWKSYVIWECELKKNRPWLLALTEVLGPPGRRL